MKLTTGASLLFLSLTGSIVRSQEVAPESSRAATSSPSEFVDSYRRTLRHARGVVERLFYEG